MSSEGKAEDEAGPASLMLAEFSLPEDPPPPVTELASGSRPPPLPAKAEIDQAEFDRAEFERAPLAQAPSDEAPASNARLRALCVSALGIVFGDIGTSPLYAFRECFSEEHGMQVSHETVLGILSLVIWSLTLTVSLKYVSYVLRADNRGEGGILALMALATGSDAARTWSRATLVILGLFGAALLYGDGMITPAISVLSAVEGLRVLDADLDALVLPGTVVILVGLFVVQRHGTASVGRIFGPVMLLWFVVLALLGCMHIAEAPSVLWSFDPLHAVTFLMHHGVAGFLIMGSVLLVVTGGEALYADMGHFGTRPIRIVWFGLVLPSLVLNYLGQGAFLLDHPDSAAHIFFGLAPAWALGPLVLLSTAATIIASQALISGVYSLTRQAIMLGYWPRVRVQHTSSRETGQVYVPLVNWMLMVATILLVLYFGSSSRLAAAYGMAVTTTMLITTVLAYVVSVKVWGWKPWQAGLLSLGFLAVDAVFFGATLSKFAHGGWVPLAIAGAVFLLMTTWRRGNLLVRREVESRVVPLRDFFARLERERPLRVPGTAVFLTSTLEGTPAALLLNFKHNQVVHERVILLTVHTEPVSFVHDHERVRVEVLEEGFVRLVARYGFMESPDVPKLLARPDTPQPPLQETTFFLGQEQLNVTSSRGMSRWRKRFYAFLSRNESRASTFFGLPSERVAELRGYIDF